MTQHFVTIRTNRKPTMGGRGKLVFKGETKKKKHKVKHDKKTAPDAPGNLVLPVASLSKPAPTTTQPIPQQPQIRRGTGRITTSGSVVTGIDTRFTKEINVGDAIVVDVDGQPEMRVVTMRLSDQSLNLSSAFSQSLATPASFSYIAKPRDVTREAKQAQRQAQVESQEEKERACGSYAGEKELVYREKTEHGSYRIKRAKVEGDVTRGDLLEMRAKKKSDKYC